LSNTQIAIVTPSYNQGEFTEAETANYAYRLKAHQEKKKGATGK